MSLCYPAPPQITVCFCENIALPPSPLRTSIRQCHPLLVFTVDVITAKFINIGVPNKVESKRVCIFVFMCFTLTQYQSALAYASVTNNCAKKITNINACLTLSKTFFWKKQHEKKSFRMYMNGSLSCSHTKSFPKLFSHNHSP